MPNMVPSFQTAICFVCDVLKPSKVRKRAGYSLFNTLNPNNTTCSKECRKEIKKNRSRTWRLLGDHVDVIWAPDCYTIA